MRSRALAEHDKRRAAVIRKFYQQEWCARGLYHMLLNSAMGTDAMIAAVAGAAELEIAQPARQRQARSGPYAALALLNLRRGERVGRCA